MFIAVVTIIIIINYLDVDTCVLLLLFCMYIGNFFVYFVHIRT